MIIHDFDAYLEVDPCAVYFGHPDPWAELDELEERIAAGYPLSDAVPGWPSVTPPQS